MLINLDHIKYKFDEGRINVPENMRGKCCFVLKEGIDEVKEKFGRDDICLKVFFTEGAKTWGDPDWGDHGLNRNREIGRVSYLDEATSIQNLCWMAGFAPRVYGLIDVERNGKSYPAQVIEFIEGKEGGVNIEKKLSLDSDNIARFDARTCHNELF